MDEELEAFRAAHDCDEEEWHEDEISSNLATVIIYTCKGCGKQCEP